MQHMLILSFLLIASVTCTAANPNTPPPGKVEQRTLNSRALADNLIGLNPARDIRIYLPHGYERSTRRYPVIYHIPFGQLMLDDPQTTGTLDAAIAEKRIGEVIFVSGDFGIADSMNFMGNGPTTGRWLDHVVEELVPFIDQHYRTLNKPAARGISGHFLGGNLAFRAAMFNPDIFGSVYGLHPVGTDIGEDSSVFNPNWTEIYSARSVSELKAPYSLPFVNMMQAYLPNPDKPPFYADFIVENVNGQLVANPAHIRKMRTSFHLAEMVPDNAENLRKLRGIKFDWGRDDANQGHVYGIRRFSLLLKDYGIPHEAEEYNGDGWGYDFSKDGRIYWNLLPFFNHHLQFE